MIFDLLLFLLISLWFNHEFSLISVVNLMELNEFIPIMFAWILWSFETLNHLEESDETEEPYVAPDRRFRFNCGICYWVVSRPSKFGPQKSQPRSSVIGSLGPRSLALRSLGPEVKTSGVRPSEVSTLRVLRLENPWRLESQLLEIQSLGVLKLGSSVVHVDRVNQRLVFSGD